ncbi:hypothetical protein PIB30_054175 [Stylosanthes scabra]|uniref:RRM domain-containing protein n=1 Tax=Stylosanthes scabra TaxID=79078 RepID=A0ABU6VI19_9FABA|nr:hypothetical protein [Stylosanthes scabra]
MRRIKEFFSFSGDIEYVELQSHDERSRIAYVTFKDAQGAETAVLLSGATIVDLSGTITPDPDYKLPPAAFASAAKESQAPGGADSALRKAEDVVMLAKGFILGKDAVNKAKTLDEKHQLTSTASAKTKSAFAAAEQKVSTAGSSLMKNRYILTGASWVTGAFNRVSKAAEDIGQKTKEKVVSAEEQQKQQVEDQYAQVLSESPKAEAAASEHHSSKPAPAQGLIL